MTDGELTDEMREAAQELLRQSNDRNMTEQELRVTMRATVRLIEKWIEEIPAK